MTPGDLAVGCRNVGYTYVAADGPVRALDDVTVEINAGSVTALAGPSGSGKSTLLRLLAGIDVPSVGRVEVTGVALDCLGGRARCRFRRGHIGYLHQAPADNLLAELTASEHLRHAAAVRRSAVDADAALAAVGLGGRGGDRPAALSGGEQQRLALACASVGTPEVVLADEPTAHLDTPAGHLLLDLIDTLAALGTAVIVASHDPVVLERASAVIQLDYGRLVIEA